MLRQGLLAVSVLLLSWLTTGGSLAADKAKPLPEVRMLVGKVVVVTSGDELTLLVGQTRHRLRLAEIDAPQPDQPYFRQAKVALEKAVLEKEVRAMVVGTTAKGTTLAVVYRDGCVNTKLVREGRAWYHAGQIPSKTLAEAEKAARREEAGLWAAASPVAPWQWAARSGNAAASTPVVPPPQFWLSTKSGIRHNSSCRWFRKTEGRPCGPDEGRPCKQCGG